MVFTFLMGSVTRLMFFLLCKVDISLIAQHQNTANDYKNLFLTKLHKQMRAEDLTTTKKILLYSVTVRKGFRGEETFNKFWLGCKKIIQFRPLFSHTIHQQPCVPDSRKPLLMINEIEKLSERFSPVQNKYRVLEILPSKRKF